MKMDEHARAWAHELVSGLLNATSLLPEQRTSLHWEIVSHLHEKAERRVEARGGNVVTLADLQAVLSEMGGRDGIAAAFLEVRVAATPRAGFGKRFGAFFIDAIVGFFSIGFLIFVIGETLPFGWGDVLFFGQDSFPLLAMGLFFLYLAMMEFKFGATVGKMAFKLRTVKVDGRPLPLESALVRNIAKAVPPLLLIDTILYVLAFQKDDQRASDRIAETIVIDTTKVVWSPASFPAAPGAVAHEPAQPPMALRERNDEM